MYDKGQFGLGAGGGKSENCLSIAGTPFIVTIGCKRFMNDAEVAQGQWLSSSEVVTTNIFPIYLSYYRGTSPTTRVRLTVVPLLFSTLDFQPLLKYS